MTDDGLITNKILLEHIQANAGVIDRIDRKLDGLSQRVDRLEGRVSSFETKVQQGFEEARQDRQVIHEDLEATILTQFEHGKQIAVLAGKPMPEDY